ncbi:hypothetical protein EDD94_5574 [Streptomyces sp. PanSC9]|nr:hypothetical protein EDD94_5574 [Streptomyces sp. PanSC9]
MRMNHSAALNALTISGHSPGAAVRSVSSRKIRNGRRTLPHAA